MNESENSKADYEILNDDIHQFDYTFKIIVIGNAGNNKNSLYNI